MILPDQIESTYTIITPHIRKTPMIEVDPEDFKLSAGSLSLKLELLQHAGSFKVRGAFTNLLTRKIPTAGVVAASGGNHGAAVAFAAMKLGVPAKIFIPSVASAAKIQQIKEYGAELEIAGERYADALAASELWVKQSGAMPIHAFDQAETLLGQGTVGLEFERQAPALDTLLVSVGGGGLIGGIASWYQGKIRVMGVEPEAAPTLTRALEAGHPVDAIAGGIAADSLAPKRVGELMFPIAQQLHRANGAGDRRRDPRSAADDLERDPSCGRTRWSSCVCGAYVWPVCALRGRASRRADLRREHYCGGFQPLNK